MYLNNLALRLYCSKNYGSILTNWALYKLLQKLGYNPYIDAKNSLIEVTQPWWCGEPWNILTDDIKDTVDAYIVGSDCSFGFTFKGEFDKRFLLEDVSVPKVSISASLLKKEYPEEQLKEIKKGLGEYRFISIRDSKFLDRIKDYLGVENPEVIIDPLLLMGSEFVNSIALQSKRTDKNYDFCYFLDKEPNRLEIFDSIINNGRECFFVPSAKADREILSRWIGKREVKMHYDNLKLKDYLYMIKNTNKVYTDSFHGTVLAILFGKEVEFIPNRTLERFDSLKEMLNLTDNIIYENQYKDIYDILDKIRNEHIKKIKKILDSLSTESLLKRGCTGCGTCSHLCPTNAITMEEDICGFKYPKVDIDKCLNCGKCKKSCHILNVNPFIKKSQSIKAVKTKEEINQKSSSAGVFTLLAEYVLKKNGVVFGVEWENNYSAKHSYIENIEDLDRFRFSKYVQSDTKNTFQEVKIFLENDRYVLYTGTPCQISALNNFLGKQYDKLITADICCNSVPSSKFLKQYLKEIGEENSKVIFRDSKQQKTYFKVTNDKGEKVIENPLYLKGFLQHYFVRDCCYDCKFASNNRQGDFTLGDFWTKKILKDNTGKISLLSINSQKGNIIWKEICQERNEILSVQEISDKNFTIGAFNIPSVKSSEFNKKEIFKNFYKSKNLIESILNTEKEVKKNPKPLNIKFSIGVPYYNREKYLKNCLESIKNQKYSNFEVICIDDGSTDKSLEIVKKFSKKDSRFKSFKNNENKGISYSRERCKNLATGDFLIFIDSDDEVTAEHLKNAYDMICRCPDIDFIKIPVRKTIERASKDFIKELKRDIFNLSDKDVEDCYSKHDFCITGVTPSFVRRLSILKDIHYPVNNSLEKNLIYPELIFNAESLCKSKKIGILKECTYITNISENSTRYMDTSFEKKLKSLDIHLNNFKKFDKKMFVPKYVIRSLYKAFKGPLKISDEYLSYFTELLKE